MILLQGAIHIYRFKLRFFKNCIESNDEDCIMAVGGR